MNSQFTILPIDIRAASEFASANPFFDEACTGHGPGDKLFMLDAYRMMDNLLPQGGKALEICGGYGALSAALARLRPDAQITMTERGKAVVESAKSHYNFPNLENRVMDFFELSNEPENNYDLIFAQASLHHLSHALSEVPGLIQRVLKPGGSAIFIFEPLGDNPLIAALRGASMSLRKLEDESNLYISTFQRMTPPFSSVQVFPYQITGYPGKILGSLLVNITARIDAALIRAKLPWLASICNVVLKK